MKVGCFNPHLTSRLDAVRSDADFNPHPTSRLGATQPGRFQSSPNLSAGCSLIAAGRCSPCSGFNSHSTSCLGTTWVRGKFPAHPGIGHPLMTFQSSPNLSAGCWFVVFQSSPNLSAGRSVVSVVSILTQPGGWVQRLNPSTFCLLTFQSSPNLLAGRSIIRALLMRFNPRPTYRLGALGRFQSSPNLSAGCWCVSILTELFIRVCCVSILAQPLGWAQHHQGFSKAGTCIFQSSPSISAGCSPARIYVKQLYPIAVSILTQPGGWVQRLNPSTFCLLTFQSSPNLLAGCRVISVGFQSSPNLLAGCANF